MELAMVEEMLEELEKYKYDKSVMYPLLKDRLGEYSEKDLSFADSFMFFEEKYLMAKRHMIQNNIHGQVLDIGAQLGFQSELFLDETSYTGVDCHNSRFFNRDKPNVSYQVGYFPVDMQFRMDQYVVFSMMSLGYFSFDYKGVDDKHYDLLEEVLATCNHLYIATDEVLTKRLLHHFPKQELLASWVVGGSKLMKASRFEVYYLGK